MSEQKIANQLNAKKIERNCPLHPDYETRIGIDFTNEIRFEIIDCCCDSFRQQLQSFVEELHH